MPLTDPNKKFLYFNFDASSGEMDSSLCFPVSRLIGVNCDNSSVSFELYFEGSKGCSPTKIDIRQDVVDPEVIFISLVDEINNGEKAFIKFFDEAERGTFPSDIHFSYGSDPGVADVLTLQGSTLTASGDASVGSDLTVTGKIRRTFTKTGTTDGDYDGDVVYFGGTTSMTTGAIYHYKSDGTWELADADAASTSDGLLAVALGAASDTNGMLLRGMVTHHVDPGAVGDVLYLSTTAGRCEATAPSGNEDIVRIVGYCLDASNGQIWFNPDNTFLEVSA